MTNLINANAHYIIDHDNNYILSKFYKKKRKSIFNVAIGMFVRLFCQCIIKIEYIKLYLIYVYIYISILTKPY